jgi:hypothetical protein
MGGGSMSTRVRVVLTNTRTSEIFTGRTAVAKVAKNFLVEHVFTAKFPDNWNAMRKSQKLKWACQFMPKEFELKLIQEAKETRKEKSLYWKLKKPAVQQGILQEAPAGLNARPQDIPPQRPRWDARLERNRVVMEDE